MAHLAKTLSFLLPGFRAARLLPPKNQRLCSSPQRCSHRVLPSLRRNSASSAALFIPATRDHCGVLDIWSLKSAICLMLRKPSNERPNQKDTHCCRGQSVCRIGIAILAALCGALTMASVHAADKPNIVIIWGDDIGQSDVSAYTFGLMGFQTPQH